MTLCHHSNYFLFARTQRDLRTAARRHSNQEVARAIDLGVDNNFFDVTWLGQAFTLSIPANGSVDNESKEILETWRC